MKTALKGPSVSGRFGVVATVATTRGSTPREAGAKMLVTGEEVFGTVGGGAVEFEAISIARKMLVDAASDRQEKSFPLGPSMDQCCGGQMTIAFEIARDEAGDYSGEDLFAAAVTDVVHKPIGSIYVYGAGHVGTALVRALSPHPMTVHWIDSRPEYLLQAPKGVHTHVTAIPESMTQEASCDAYHVVMTHSHAQDLEIVAKVLERDFSFCGLIGSATKRATFERRLRERGLSKERVSRLVCPIGLGDVRDKRPQVIAASVTGQLLRSILTEQLVSAGEGLT